MSYFPYEDDIRELANRPDLNYELIVNYMSSIGAELGIQCDNKYALAPEVMSRLKGMWGMVMQFGSEAVDYIAQTNQLEHFDFLYEQGRYEVKARRGIWTYERFYKDPYGPGCEASKEPYSDYFITVTADGYVLCWNTKDKYHTGQPQKNSVTDFNGGHQIRTEMNYYRMKDCIWRTCIDYTDWAVIDKVWDEHKESKN